MTLDRSRTIKLALLLPAIAAAIGLSFAPEWVRPVDPASGSLFTELPAADPHHVAPMAPQRALAVFVLCLTLWVTHAIPLPATGLLAIALISALGVAPTPRAFAYFGNSAVFFILGVFMLAAAMIETGLSKRLTLVFLRRFDSSPRRLSAGVLVAGSFFALWMPGYAVAAMMYPIVLEIAEALGLKKGKSDYAKCLFMALAWGAVIGSVGTYLGGARALLAVELYTKFHPDATAPSFLGWASKTMPIVVLLTAAAYVILLAGRKPDVGSVDRATRMLRERVAALGPLSRRERRLAALIAVTIVAWIVLPTLSKTVVGRRIDIATIALLSGVAVFPLRIVRWNRIQEFINWGVLVMYGGAVALGAAIADTHGMEWIAQRSLPYLPDNRYLLLALVAIVSILMTEAISNAAVVALLLPVGFAFCDRLGIEPLTVVYMVTIPAGLAFWMPMSSPPNAIAFSAGYHTIRDTLRRGPILTAVALAVFFLVALIYWPLVGLKL